MKRLGPYRWISIGVLLFASAPIPFTGYAGGAESGITAQLECEPEFLAPQTVFEVELFAGRIGPPNLPFAPIVTYGVAATNHSMPNSMARLEYRREYYPHLNEAAAKAAIERARERDFVCSKAAMEAEFESIRRGISEDLWRALEFLMSQNLDFTYVGVAAQLAARLDPERFERIAIEVTKEQPAKARQFNAVRSNWLR
jgi:hypothetical protein